MSDNAPTFRTVMRGYEPSEVDRRIAELSAAVAAARQQSAGLARQVAELTAVADQAARQPQAAPVEASFGHFGERIGKILTLAQEEADELTRAAAEHVRSQLAEVEQATARSRAEADQYAAETRTVAEREAARIVEQAKRTADQLLDEADRQASTRREEAEAVYEHQRALAAEAAADFEQTLAARRTKAEQDFRARTVQGEHQLSAAQQHVAQLKAQSERAATEAARKAATMVEDA
ncbi:MAG: hypothetical protein QOK10_3173, partial [Pseudonocardiales bacterium]|nr:hypothetical protein [Pseudonocardiales bacterium]